MMMWEVQTSSSHWKEGKPSSLIPYRSSKSVPNKFVNLKKLLRCSSCLHARNVNVPRDPNYIPIHPQLHILPERFSFSHTPYLTLVSWQTRDTPLVTRDQCNLRSRNIIPLVILPLAEGLIGVGTVRARFVAWALLRGSWGARILATTIGGEHFTNRLEEGTVAGKASRDYSEADLGMGPSGYWYVAPWKQVSEVSECMWVRAEEWGKGPDM